MADVLLAVFLALLQALQPDGVSWGFVFVLIISSAFTSAMTAAFGLGGGLALLAVMAAGLPMATVIPVHGVVQLGSNAGRAGLMARHISWRLVALFAGGAVLGAVLAAPLVRLSPDAVVRIAAGGFALFMVWGPRPHLPGRSDLGFSIGATGAGALAMFVGATGPFTGALLAMRDLARRVTVATFAACMTSQHLVKLGAFVVLGFAFTDWLGLMVAMIVSGFLGTVLGVRLLARMPERVFKLGFRVILSVAAGHMMITGLVGLVSG